MGLRRSGSVGWVEDKEISVVIERYRVWVSVEEKSSSLVGRHFKIIAQEVAEDVGTTEEVHEPVVN